MKIEIYTDGSSRSNGYDNARGGYGFVVLQDGEKIYEHSKGEKGVTNQQMELKAAISALSYLSQREDFGFITCEIFSDSAYLVNCYKNKWYLNWHLNGWKNSKGQPVANKEYWEQLIPFFENSNITFSKVKGHTGLKDWNDYVDGLATEAADSVVIDK